MTQQPSSAHYFADPAAASAYAAYRQEQAREYGQYVATQLVVHEGVPIFAVGQAVPASTVDAHPWLLDAGVQRTAPPPEPGVDRAEQLRARRAQLEAELAAMDKEEADANAANGDDYESKTVTELQSILSDRELSTIGRKADLIARLREDDASTDDTPEE